MRRLYLVRGDLEVAPSSTGDLVFRAQDDQLTVSHLQSATEVKVAAQYKLKNGVNSIPLAKVGVILLAIRQPWQLEFPDLSNETQALPASTRQRYLIISTTGWTTDSESQRPDRWHDGPIAHVGGDGKLFSFLPSGGPGSLVLPAKMPGARVQAARESISPFDMRTIPQLEGSMRDRALRCLPHAFDRLLKVRATRCLIVRTWTLATITTLCLMRMASHERSLALVLPFPRSSPIGVLVRRLLENLGIRPTERIFYPHLVVDDLAGLVPTELHDAFCYVIPEKLRRAVQSDADSVLCSNPDLLA